jgi:ABC-type polar amino acid transport system ATPase subunit
MKIANESPACENAISVNGLCKSFGAFDALKSISLNVKRGEKIVLCGPSGSGKSTLIRCINRLERHDKGAIQVDGIELTDDARHIQMIRADVGMVFQHFNLFPHMTVLQNCILAPMLVRRMKRTDAETKAREMLDRVRIGNQADKYPAQLSGGQQQRVAIARALCMSPTNGQGGVGHLDAARARRDDDDVRDS